MSFTRDISITRLITDLIINNLKKKKNFEGLYLKKKK